MIEEDKKRDRSFTIDDSERLLIDVHPIAGRITVPEGCKVDPTILIPLGQDSAKVPSAYMVEEVDELGNPL